MQIRAKVVPDTIDSCRNRDWLEVLNNGPPLSAKGDSTGLVVSNNSHMGMWLPRLHVFAAAAAAVSLNALVLGQSTVNDIIYSDSEKGCSASQVEQYSMPWHIAGIFIVMGSSAAGIFTTLSLGMRARKPAVAKVLQILKMFGIGVIMATGWFHLLPDAFKSFTSPCLPAGWASYGAGFVGVFALTSSFIVHIIEMSSEGGHSHGLPESPTPSSNFSFSSALPGKLQASSHFSVHREESEKMSTMILEAGILFHSLIIGLSLGVTGDSETFKVLLMAVCFHQFFEGLALGALIARLNKSFCKKFFVMGLLYPMTTPFGIFIGILVRRNFDANAEGAILAEGIFNSLSVGILMYTSYAELLPNEITHSENFKEFSKVFKFFNMMALYMGVAAMAILAKWS